MAPYPGDLSDQEWRIFEPLIPPGKAGGRPRSVEMRSILNGMFYQARAAAVPGAWCPMSIRRV
jgi:transposase